MNFYTLRFAIIPTLLMATAAGIVTWQVYSSLERARARELVALIDDLQLGRLSDEEGLVRIAHVTDRRELQRWLRYPVIRVRRAAARCLGAIGGPEVVPALTVALHDGDRATARLAQLAVRRARARIAQSRVVRLMEASEAGVRAGDLDGALAALDECVALLEPSAAERGGERRELGEIHFRRGAVLLAAGQAGEALDAFEGAVQCDPLHFDAWMGYGHAAAMLGLGVAARDAYLQAMRINPNMESMREALGL